MANTITHVKLTPTVADTGKATVTVNGTAVDSGQPSAAIALNVGTNTLTVQVTAEDTTTTKDYTVTITRAGREPTPGVPRVSLSASPNPVRPAAVPGDPDRVWQAEVTVTATLSRILSTVTVIPVTVTRTTSEQGDHGIRDSIVIGAGALTGWTTILVLEDRDAEDETFTVALNTARLPRPLTAGGTESVTVTIEDTDTAAAPAAAPANFTVTARARYLLLRWDKPTDRTTHYDIEYKTTAAPDQAATGRDPTTGWVSRYGYGTEDTTTRHITRLTSGTQYDVRVRAVNDTAPGPWATARTAPD